MSETTFTRKAQVVDQYGNRHRLGDELARGGQGVVYRTGDADLAIKQPLGINGLPAQTSDLEQQFQNIRCLPLPTGIPISLPLAVLRNPDSGYVMKLLSEMVSFGAFSAHGDLRAATPSRPLPDWLSGIRDPKTALPLLHYAMSGSTKRRLLALSKVAAILARLHAAGLVYGDISPNNCFMGEGESPEVWLIDADNLRFELVEGGSSVYTARYGAPEIIQGIDRSRPRTDIWAFAVMTFETLALVHPFIGRQVLGSGVSEGGWDAESLTDGIPIDMDERAYAGFLPFVDDEHDGSNAALSGLPRELVLTTQLAKLFQETFGPGRVSPWRRPSMTFWALELTRAHDQSVSCPRCSMSYFLELSICPYCGNQRPPIAVAKTQRWQITLQEDGVELKLPHRLFHPFSVEQNWNTEHEVVLDFARREACHSRGTDRLPTGLTFEFISSSQ